MKKVINRNIYINIKVYVSIYAVKYIYKDDNYIILRL